MSKIGVLFVIGFIIGCDSLNAAAGAIDYRPFFAAVELGDVDRVKGFWEKNRGMDIEKRDCFGNTPLHVASSYGKVEVIKILLEHGANIEAKDEHDWTPLIATSLCGKTDVARLLLAHGADKEAKDRHGYTPLLNASVHNHKEMVELLLECGANKEAKNNNGETAAKVAKYRGHNAIRELIKLYHDPPDIKEPGVE